ncbi:MAG TPA: hypothetical protein VEY51_08830 [Chondromyces sp.]|nr:hypothetical protein [Chondromyces sp.]
MEHIIIFFGNSNLGFELCERFLEEGYKVNLVDAEAPCEEFLLQVGRNANFSMNPLYELERSEPAIFIFPYCSFPGERKGHYLDEVISHLEEFWLTEEHSFLFLFPEQTEEGEQLENNAWQPFYHSMKEKEKMQLNSLSIWPIEESESVLDDIFQAVCGKVDSLMIKAQKVSEEKREEI